MMNNGIRILLALNAALLGALAWMWFDPQGQLKHARWSAPQALNPDFSDVSTQPAEPTATDTVQFIATLERPLFSPTRRPPPPVVAPPAPPVVIPDPFENLQLLGVFSNARMSGILARVDGKVQRVKAGESLGSWVLKDVQGRNVTFTKGEETRVVTLVHAREPVATPTAEAPAAAPPGVPAPMANSPADALARTQQELRERLAGRNAMRAKLGLPLITE